MSLCLALFSRFGSGYTLTLRAVSAAAPPPAKSKGPSDDPDSSSPSSGSEAVLKLKDLVAKTFPLAELKEEHYNQVGTINHQIILDYYYFIIESNSTVKKTISIALDLKLRFLSPKQLQYQLPMSQVKLPVIFREMEKAKSR